MENFKEIFGIIVRTIGGFGLGFGGSTMLLNKDYKTASWVLLVASILFMVGYFVERWSN